MLMPRKRKYRKEQRGVIKGKASAGNFLAFGDFGLKSLEGGWVTARQIEAARRAITRHVKRGGQIWIRIFPHKPVTATSPETPMGTGKGSVDHFVAVVKPGTILFEIGSISPTIACEALRLAAHKLPIKTKIVEKEKYEK